MKKLALLGLFSVLATAAFATDPISGVHPGPQTVDVTFTVLQSATLSLDQSSMQFDLDPQTGDKSSPLLYRVSCNFDATLSLDSVCDSGIVLDTVFLDSSGLSLGHSIVIPAGTYLRESPTRVTASTPSDFSTHSGNYHGTVTMTLSL